MIEDFSAIPELPTIMGPARQVAYVVDDIDIAVARWGDQGVGPFLVARNEAPLQNAFYRGESAQTVHLNMAFAYVGDIQLELIELIGDTPSIYYEAIERQITGVHHYAVCVENFAEAYDWALANGYEAVVDVGIEGIMRMSYMENLGDALILELIEWNALTRPYFDGIERLIGEVGDDELAREFRLADITASD